MDNTFLGIGYFFKDVFHQTRPQLRVGSVEAPPFLSSLSGDNTFQGFIWDLLNHIAESQVWMGRFS